MRRQTPGAPARGHFFALLLTFGAAGVVGLVFEIVWVRTLTLVLGASNYAVSVVLAAYMAGLGLGGSLFGRWTTLHRKDPLSTTRAYSLLLAGIGITGAAVVVASPLFGAVAAPVMRAVGWNSAWAILLRGLFGFVALLLPATMLGGLIPLVSHVGIDRPGVTGTRVAWLYFFNTGGSVLGALLTGFILLERLGVTATAVVAAVLALALAAAGLALRPGRAVPGPVAVDGRRAEAAPTEPGRGTFAAVIIVYGLSGFAGLAYQVAWMQAVATTIGQPVYAVTIVTSTFLAGLAIGSVAVGRLADRWRDPLVWLGAAECAIAVCATLALSLLALSARGVLGWAAETLGATWLGNIIGVAGFCFIVFLLPTFLMGTTFPIAARAVAPGNARAGVDVGRLYAANSYGALAGALVAGFVLVPALGVTRATVVLAGVSLASAAVAFAASRAGPTVRRTAPVLLAVLFCVIAAVMWPQRFRFLPPDVAANPGTWRVLYYRESSEGVVTTAEHRSGPRQTWVNSSVVCGSALPALKPVRIMGVLPFAVIDSPKDILVIGYGLGVAASMLVNLGTRPVDCVEICPGVVAASRAFSDCNQSVFADPRLRLMPGDGRNYLLCTGKTYDVISCDPTHPSFGSGALYTTEFYRLCLKRLRPGGVFTLYLPFHSIRGGDFRTLLGTFRAAFPNCALWIGVSHGVLVGRKDAPVRVDYRRALSLFDSMPTASRAALRDVFVDDAAALVGCMALDSAGMSAAAADAGIATDDQPEFEYAGARAGGAAGWVTNARLILDRYTGPASVLDGVGPDSARVAAAAGAARARFEANIATMRCDRAGQIAAFERAMATDPLDREARLLLRMSASNR